MTACNYSNGSYLPSPTRFTLRRVDADEADLRPAMRPCQGAKPLRACRSLLLEAKESGRVGGRKERAELAVCQGERRSERHPVGCG